MGQFHYCTPTSTNQLMRKKLIHAGKVFRKRDAKKTYADCRGPEAAPFMIESEALNYLHHDFVQSEKTFHFFLPKIFRVSTDSRPQNQSTDHSMEIKSVTGNTNSLKTMLEHPCGLPPIFVHKRTNTSQVIFPLDPAYLSDGR